MRNVVLLFLQFVFVEYSFVVVLFLFFNSNNAIYSCISRGHSGFPLPKGNAHYWVSRVDWCQFDSTHAGLTSAVPLSFTGSTSLGLKSSDDSQHRVACVDNGQTGDVLCGLVACEKSYTDVDFNSSNTSNEQSNFGIEPVDWKLLHIQDK